MSEKIVQKFHSGRHDYFEHKESPNMRVRGFYCCKEKGVKDD